MKASVSQIPVSKPVGIWIRVSTEDQAQGESPEHHLARARAYATAKGWTVKEVYDLAGVSGKSVMEQPEAKRMLADIRKSHITGLIFSKLARLARNTRELLDFAVPRQFQWKIGWQLGDIMRQKNDTRRNV